MPLTGDTRRHRGPSKRPGYPTIGNGINAALKGKKYTCPFSKLWPTPKTLKTPIDGQAAVSVWFLP